VDLSGIFPPIATPFSGDDLDWRALSSNTARWTQTGLRGLVVLGSNGEAPLIDAGEAEQIVAAVRKDLPRDRLLIAGTGQQSTRQTIALTKAVARAGADVALVLTPYFYKSQMSADALVRHYTEIADASPIPIVMYNMPPVTGVALSIPVVQKLAAHPRIAGIKDSSGDVAYVQDLVANTSRPFQVLVGVAPNLYAALCVGAQGGVVAVANVMPELCVTLYTLVREGRHAEALAIQRALTPLARAVTTTYGVSGLKAALDITGYVGGPPRLPLLPLGSTQVQEIRQMVERLQAWAESQPFTAPQEARS
jgi:dihydrodipicolinate synthase/N-acetylneuraminate lyase